MQVAFGNVPSASHAGSEGGGRITVSWRPFSHPRKYHVVANVDGSPRVVGSFIVPKSPFAGRLPVIINAVGPFIVVDDGDAMSVSGTISLFSQASPGARLTYDEATTEMLGTPGTLVAVEYGAVGAAA